MAKQKGVKIKYAGPKQILVVGKQDELVQLVLNIIDNGVKMSSKGTKIIVEGATVEQWNSEQSYNPNPISEGSSKRQIISLLTDGSSYGRLRIRDEGPGFQKDHLPRVSERFYRIAGDRSSREKGTGLGLAIVKHIIVRHRGGLMIETAEHVGTEFSIFIPMSETATEQEHILEESDIV